ncbi:transposase [Caballeronia sp. EK]|nr:transposase [Caballeronia sp. EK]
MGRRGADNRLFVEALLWIARTGSPWRDLPKEFGRWHTAYIRFLGGGAKASETMWPMYWRKRAKWSMC